MEILTREATNGTIYNVIHEPVYNPDGTESNLTFRSTNGEADLTKSFGVYRFDWMPGRVDFFYNGKPLSNMTTNIPDEAGAIYLNNWSNGGFLVRISILQNHDSETTWNL